MSNLLLIDEIILKIYLFFIIHSPSKNYICSHNYNSKDMFENLSDRLEGAFRNLKGDGKLTELNIATSIKEIRRALVAADVNYKIAKEFTDTIRRKEDLLKVWEKGWACLFNAIDPLTEEDFEKEIFIRNMGHSVVEAINRQLAHYAYHIGQIVFIGKMLANDNWSSLSIPKGNSKAYNTEKFNKPKRTEHFTDDL